MIKRMLIGVALIAAVTLTAQSTALIPAWNGSRYEWWTVQRLATAVAPLLPAATRTRYEEKTFALTGPQSSFVVPGSTTWATKSDVCVYLNGLHAKHEDYAMNNNGGSLALALISAVNTSAGHELVIRYPVE